METERDRKIKAFEFLCGNRLGVISTISSLDYTPQGSLVYYVVDGKNIYFITTQQSRKIHNLTSRNSISFTLFSEIPPLELQIEGDTQFVTDQDKKTHISKIYLENANKNPDTINWPPILKLPNDEGFHFVKITISKFKFSDFTKSERSIIEGTPKDWV